MLARPPTLTMLFRILFAVIAVVAGLHATPPGPAACVSDPEAHEVARLRYAVQQLDALEWLSHDCDGRIDQFAAK